MTIGIDLGTANVLVYVKGKGIIIRKPSVVAVSESHHIVAVGEDVRFHAHPFVTGPFNGISSIGNFRRNAADDDPLSGVNRLLLFPGDCLFTGFPSHCISSPVQSDCPCGRPLSPPRLVI